MCLALMKDVTLHCRLVNLLNIAAGIWRIPALLLNIRDVTSDTQIIRRRYNPAFISRGNSRRLISDSSFSLLQITNPYAALRDIAFKKSADLLQILRFAPRSLRRFASPPKRSGAPEPRHCRCRISAYCMLEAPAIKNNPTTHRAKLHTIKNHTRIAHPCAIRLKFGKI